ncbi:DNA mismatch repair endonuclease MutL [[Eubacterium] cellulosolvens]
MPQTQSIRILDDKTINKIAAGEVIERPASVVKELVENAIDADSTKIVVEIEQAGKKLIRVSDNGDGIPADELEIAFQRHSTSKIATIDDVFNLSTMGFRGEALASIAAVARIECVSSDGKDVTGRKVVIDGGVVKSVTEIGCPKGTTVKVKDLFYNVPARYKYLKTDQTELAHITEAVTRLAIYYHTIDFKLFHDGKELLNLPTTKNKIDNLVNVFGKELVRNLVSISYDPKVDQPLNDLVISGYIGKPSVTRSDSSYQLTFVNGRYVECKVISNAIKDAYRTLVMKHRYPVVILFISLTSESVDVNIHPTKLWVRFEQEQVIYNEVFNTIKETLKHHDLIPEAVLPQKPQTISLKAITTFGLGKPGYPTPVSGRTTAQPPPAMVRDEARLSQDQRLTQALLKPGGTDHQQAPLLAVIKPLGQILDTYIIAQAAEGMLIIDQHAAHERIMYERIKKRYIDSAMATQELLEPVALELSPKEQGFLKNNLKALEDLSFVIDEMGENSYYVKSIPVILGRLQTPEFIHDIISDLILVTKEKEQDIIKDKMIQVMACKSAIKAGRPLTLPEIQQLLNELYSIENPYTCAHGRPTIISMTETALKKMFKRIV